MKWTVGLFLFGAVLCTALDHVHVVTGVLAYPRPFLFDQAWWVPLLFGTATLVMIASYPALTGALGEGPEPGRARDLGTSLAWFIAVYASSGVFKDHPTVLVLVYLGTFLARALLWPSRGLWANALGAAVAGPIVEASLAGAGLFHYNVPGVLGVPVWLPGLYLHGAFVVRAFTNLRRA